MNFFASASCGFFQLHLGRMGTVQNADNSVRLCITSNLRGSRPLSVARDEAKPGTGEDFVVLYSMLALRHVINLLEFQVMKDHQYPL